MIKLSRLLPDTKVISDEDPSGLYDAEDLERPDFDKSGLRFFVANKVNQQSLSRCDVKYLFDIGEERDGYDGQAQDCIDSISDKEMNIILGILNHAIVQCPAYTGGEEIDGLAFTKNQTLHGEGATSKTAINDLTDKISDKAVFYKNNTLCVPKLSHVTNDIDFICKQTVQPHKGKTKVLDYVIQDLQSRAEMGKEKYGHYLETNNGRNALQDAYEEALDMCMYLKQKLLEEKGK